MLFQRKIEVVDAFKWTGDEQQIDDPMWMVDALKSGRAKIHNPGMLNMTMEIKNNTYFIIVSPGAWIVRMEKDLVVQMNDKEFHNQYCPYETAASDANQYQQDCLKLENKDFETIKARLTAPMIIYLYMVLDSQIKLSKNIDALKKHLFYGKKFEGYTNDIDLATPSPEESTNGAYELVNDNCVRKLHSILGLCTETGELAEILEKHIFDREYTTQLDWTKEFSDVAWYLAQGTDTIPQELATVFHINIQKLRKRYPEKFSEAKAQVHDGH